MPDLAKALRAEIRAASAGELARALAPLRRIEKSLSSLVLIARRNRGGEGRRGPGRPPGPPPGRRSAAGAEATVKPSEVRTLRKRFGMNRPEFGRLAGVSTWTVFMWEHGKVMPSPASADRLRQIEKLTPAAAAAAAAKPRRRRGPGRPRRT